MYSFQPEEWMGNLPGYHTRPVDTLQCLCEITITGWLGSQRARRPLSVGPLLDRVSCLISGEGRYVGWKDFTLKLRSKLCV